jgi:hypothetical protein
MTLLLPKTALIVALLAVVGERSRHPGAIMGQVHDDAGRGVAGVQVNIGADCGTMTGPQGQFALTSVEHGEYVLHASAPGYAQFADTIAVTPNDTLRVTVALVPTASQQERDNAQARVLMVLGQVPGNEGAKEWWVRSCH